MPLQRLTLVFDADRGLLALLADVAKKLAGREDCALCALTYGPLGKRAAWAACEAALAVPVDERHRDEVPAAWGLSPRDLPCIVGHDDRGARIAVSRAEIIACGSSVEALEAKVRAAITGP